MPFLAALIAEFSFEIQESGERLAYVHPKFGAGTEGYRWRKMKENPSRR
jgi:hypothetical protein